MRKVCALLYYIHSTIYNQINWKWLPIPIMQFYRLVKFRIWRRFHASLSVRVSDTDQHVKYVRKYCKHKNSNKLYCRMTSGFTQHYMLLHNPKIIHTKTFFVPIYPCTRKYCPIQNCCNIHCYTHSRFTRLVYF